MEQVIDRQIKELKCPYQNKAVALCFSQYCKSNAFMCCKQQCKCINQDHFACRYLSLKFLMQKLKFKKDNASKNNKKTGLQALIKIYKEAIDTLSKDLQSLLDTMDYLGLQNNQMIFMKYIDEGNYQRIDGQLIGKVQLQIAQNPEHNEKGYLHQKQVNKIWKTQSKIFDDIREELKKMSKMYRSNLNSKITNEQQLIKQFLGAPVAKFKLLYRASENSFSTDRFHTLCDGIPNTLLLVMSQFDKIIGGYTPLQWCSPSPPGSQILQTDKTEKSFIFSITNKEKYPLINSEQTIQCRSDFGPIFGKKGSNDIAIVNNSNIQGCYTNFPTAYNNGNYTRSQDSFQCFTGSTNDYYFKTRQWEVHQVIFI